MAYGADDYEVRTLWQESDSGGKAQVNFAINSTHTPSTIANSMDSNLQGATDQSPTIFMNDHWALIEVDVFSLDLMGTVFIKTDTDAQGQQGTGATPIDSCVVVSLLGLLPGRSNRGRQYWPGIDHSFIIPGGARWDLGAQTNAAL